MQLCWQTRASAVRVWSCHFDYKLIVNWFRNELIRAVLRIAGGERSVSTICQRSKPSNSIWLFGASATLQLFPYLIRVFSRMGSRVTWYRTAAFNCYFYHTYWSLQHRMKSPTEVKQRHLLFLLDRCYFHDNNWESTLHATVPLILSLAEQYNAPAVYGRMLLLDLQS